MRKLKDTRKFLGSSAFLMAFVSLTFVLGCVTGRTCEPLSDGLYHKQGDVRSPSDYQASSRIGMVVTAHPLASEAGAQMLREGGNAIDAFVASSFAISVVRPQSTGLGGGGFMLFHDAKERRQRVFDFRERAPRKAKASMYVDASNNLVEREFEGVKIKNPAVDGHLSVAIPGLVKGLIEIHRDFGKLPLAKVVTPAIRIAEDGFPIYDALAKALEERSEILKIFPASRNVFFLNGLPRKSGDILKQADLANTLRLIVATNGGSFYRGETARLMVEEMRRGQGIIDAVDLAQYRVIERVPISGLYRGRKVVTMPPPSSGGVHLIEMLNMLEPFNLPSRSMHSDSYVHLLAEVMRRAFADRAKYLGDPDFVDVPVSRLTSKSHAQDLMKSFHEDAVTQSKNLAHVSPSGESPSTSHISVVDSEGNAIASTQTINYAFGSCVVAEGTGVLLNDEMDDFTTRPGTPNVFGLVTGTNNDIVRGKTPLSSMTPTFVFDMDSHIQLILGSPGGPRIINAVLQPLIGVVDFDMDLRTAVHAARIHHQWMPDALFLEDRTISEPVKTKLAERGHVLKSMPSVGDVQAIQILPDGVFIGVSDVRSDGKPVGL